MEAAAVDLPLSRQVVPVDEGPSGGEGDHVPQREGRPAAEQVGVAVQLHGARGHQERKILDICL